MDTMAIVEGISPTPYNEAKAGGCRLRRAPLAAPLMSKKTIRGAKRPEEAIQIANIEIAINTMARQRLVKGPTRLSARKPNKIRPTKEARL